MTKQRLHIGKIATVMMAVGTFTVMAGAGAAVALDFFGSDTLFDPITAAVAMSGVDLTYQGTGSGNGEAALQGTLVIGGVAKPKQAIAPMSRNLKSTMLAAHATWEPTRQQILSLDGLVLVQKGGSPFCANNPEGTVPFDPLDTVGQHWMRYMVAGADGTGSLAACSHKVRLDAIKAAATCNGATNLALQHFYRRDDNSGTSDSVKDFLDATNFCNNGVLGGAGKSKGPTNLDDADLD